MKNLTFFLRFVALTLFLNGCTSGSSGVEPLGVLATPTAFSSSGTFLFLDAAYPPTRSIPEKPHIVRWRLVQINWGVLLDESGQARPVSEIVLNLFPDVTYVGVIQEIAPEGDGYVWSGYLKDIEFSALYMVYTSGVFLAHFDSPLGVYEVAFVEDDLYRVIQIEQAEYPGGEG